MSKVNLGFQIPLSVQEILDVCPKFTVASTWQQLYELATCDAVNGVHEVAYEVPGRGRVLEAKVCRVKNGIAANYVEPYMRRRDPDCMVIADDLLPEHDAARVLAEVGRARGSRSLASHLQSRLHLKGAKVALLRECLAADAFADPAQLAATIKVLPLRLLATRPLDEAISSAGGVCFAALDERLMLKKLPGVFCAGEMLDWEAPTGGYLLTACLASGHAAGRGVRAWLRN